MRHAALPCIGQHSSDVVDALASALGKEKEARTRVHIVLALGMTRTLRARATLERAATPDADMDVRKVAKECVGEFIR